MQVLLGFCEGHRARITERADVGLQAEATKQGGPLGRTNREAVAVTGPRLTHPVPAHMVSIGCDMSATGESGGGGQ